MNIKAKGKISIIGAGNVGGLTAMRIAEAELGEVVLIDVRKDIALAKAEDIKDSSSVLNKNSYIVASDDISYIKNSQIVVVTAGQARRPGMDRQDLLKINLKILKEVSSAIKKYSPYAIVVVVTNPVDIMTYFMLKQTGLKRQKVFGMGSSLDSARFSTQIWQRLGIGTNLIKAQVIGAHSNLMLPLVDSAQVRDRLLKSLVSEKDISDIVYNTRHRGENLVRLFGSGSAYFAPSAAVFNIIKAIIKDKKIKITVSCLLNGEYGLNDVCIGVPVEIGRKGIEKFIKLRLNKQEQDIFFDSANKIKQALSPLVRACLPAGRGRGEGEY